MKTIRMQNGDIISFDYIKRCSFDAQNSTIRAITNDDDQLVLYQDDDAGPRYSNFWQAIREGQQYYSFALVW